MTDVLCMCAAQLLCKLYCATFSTTDFARCASLLSTVLLTSTSLMQNNNCERALYVSTFPTTDFGVTSITPQLFSLPATVLRGTFASLDPELLDAVITAVTSDDPAPSADPECLARCGLDGGAMAPMAGGNEAMEEDAADASSPAEAAEESGGDESGGEESGGEETGGEESGGDESGGEDSGNYEASEGPRMQGGRMMGPSKQDKKGDH